MDIKDDIKKKSEELIRKAETLPNIPINWEEPILIKCEELNAKEDLRLLAKVLVENKIRPGVYYFEVISNHNRNVVVEKLEEFKKTNASIACPKIDKINIPNCSRYLYCGSVKKSLHTRFTQHLGFGSQQTYSLQLIHWAKDLKLELKFHYCWLDKDYEAFTELVESALAKKIQPLVGKIA